MKEEAQEFLEQEKIKELVKKYSQFINFDIYLWNSSVCTCYIVNSYRSYVLD